MYTNRQARMKPITHESWKLFIYKSSSVADWKITVACILVYTLIDKHQWPSYDNDFLLNEKFVGFDAKLIYYTENYLISFRTMEEIFGKL